MRRLVSVMLIVAAMLVSGAISAFAAPGGNGSTTAGGYSVKAAVNFSGDAAPAGGGVMSVPVPATCWWEPAKLYRTDGSVADPTNADELEAWYKVDLPRMINGSFTVGQVGYGDWSKWQPVLDAIRAGHKITAYQPSCRQEAPACALNGFAGSAMPAGATAGACGIPVAIGFFPAGNPPEPQIVPADLAQVARDHMDIPEPQVDRNPKVTALAGATLVGLPTWFWVTDPTSVGGTTGTRTIHAAVAGGVWAEVLASTNGLVLSSPWGGEGCGPDQALTHYATGVSESSACTVSFARSSVGYPDGFPVDASTSWSATWTGSGNTGGDLARLQRGTVVDVPVSEVQTIVTDAG
jgi:hypothetical protein